MLIMNKISLLRLAIASTCMALAVNATAATVTDNLAVSATVIANCSIDATTVPLAFGNYDAIVANSISPKDAPASVDVTCTNGAVGVVLEAGNGTSYSGGTRHMTKGADELAYELYSDFAGGTAFAAEPVTADGTTQTIDIFGRVPAAQTSAAAGAYTDTIVMTATF